MIPNPPSPHFQTLHAAAELIEVGRQNEARRVLENFPPLRVDRSTEDLKSFIFMKALWRLVDSRELSHEGNLYLRDFESRQIDIFNLMTTRMPIVNLAVDYANQILYSMIAPHTNVVLVDVGIGTGQQIAKLLDWLKQNEQGPRALTIVGIEPSAESLRRAQSMLEAYSSPQFQVTFVPIQGLAESLPPETWERIRSFGPEVVVNEAFALHHVSSSNPQADLKDAVLRAIASLKPIGFVLSEPHSDHQTSQLAKRLENAWRHYGLVFDLIDELDLKREEKDAMKLHFFGREVDDVVGTDEKIRSERHETADQWERRLVKAGFQLLPCDGLTGRVEKHSVRAVKTPTSMHLEYAGETIVAILPATT